MMKANDLRKLKTLEILTEYRSIPREQLESLVGVSTRSLKTYIKELTLQGYNIKSSKGIISIADESDDNGVLAKKADTSYITKEFHESANSSKLRKVRILLELQKSVKPLSFTDIFELLEGGKTVSDKTLQYTLKELVSEHLISRGSDNTYSITSNAPVMLSLSIEDGYRFINTIDRYGADNPQSDELLDIRNRLAQALSTSLVDSFERNDRFILYEKACPNISEINSFLRKFREYPYDSKWIEISFRTKKMGVITRKLCVGLLVYVVLLDNLYIICEDEEGKYCTIPYQTIEKINPLEEESDVYKSAKYIELFETMLSVSTEEAFDVFVRFDKIVSIHRKLENYVMPRPRAVITEDDNNYYLTDSVSGLNDFASYLRRFGKSCEVIEPEALKNKMIYSAKRTIDSYNRFG